MPNMFPDQKKKKIAFKIKNFHNLYSIFWVPSSGTATEWDSDMFTVITQKISKSFVYVQVCEHAHCVGTPVCAHGGQKSTSGCSLGNTHFAFQGRVLHRFRAP